MSKMTQATIGFTVTAVVVFVETVEVFDGSFEPSNDAAMVIA